MTAPDLRGRSAQLSTIARHLKDAREGRGSVIVVRGGPGFGKSRLLAASVKRAEATGIRTGQGRAAPGDPTLPLGPVLAAVAAARHGTAPAEVATERYWMLDDVGAALEQTALSGPLLLTLDDAQWLDTGSLLALRTLPARLAGLPIVWLIAVRAMVITPEVRTTLDQLLDDGATAIEVGPLDDAAVAAVARDITGAEPEPRLLEFAARANGSPFLLTELLRGLREDGLVRLENGVAVLHDARLPARVRDTMRSRLDRLPEATSAVAYAASVLGPTFGFDPLAAMLGVPPLSLLGPVEQLKRVDVLVDAGEVLAWRHDLIREAVRDALPAGALRTLQRQAVDALLRTGSPPVEVARQLAASAEPGDLDAVATLRAATRLLAGSDPRAAADLSEAALRLAGGDDPELVTETILLLHAAGRIPAGKALVDSRLRRVLTVDQEAGLLQGLAVMFGLSADVRAEASVRALALPGLDPVTRARHHASLIHSRLSAGRTEDGRALLDAAPHEVEPAGDPQAQFAVTLARAFLRYQDADYAGALAMADEAIRAGSEADEPGRLVLALNTRAECLATLDRYDEALQATAESLARARRARQTWGVLFLDGSRGRKQLQLGQLDDAVAALDAAVSGATDASSAGVHDASAAAALAQAALHVGDERQLSRSLAFLRTAYATGVPAVQRHTAWALALSEWSSGDRAIAHRHLRDRFDLDGALIDRFPGEVTDPVHIARIAVAAGDDELADAAVESAERRTRNNPGVGTIEGVRAHVLGLRDHDLDTLVDAVDVFAKGDRKLSLAAAAEDAGRVAIEYRRQEQAVELLGRSLEVFAAQGATADASRVRGLLRSLGVRRRLATTARPQSGWEALTDSELAVARLVAHGLTNREVAERLYVSAHTVSSHLRSTFTKLGLNSRVDLARLVARRDEELA